METLLEGEFQERTTSWLRAATVACMVAAVAGPLAGYPMASLLLPLVHCFVFWMVLVALSLPNPRMGESAEYIKSQHPRIWKRLRPWGDQSFNSFASFAFYAGKYDDGTDERLQIIKQRSRRLTVLTLWPFALIPVCWIVTLIVYFVSGAKP